ncbi:hypothetical protein BHE82_01825 [Rice orange leaf phytoplasma]|nr:hypothetical protein BHE82_01825 [Rice orange leaf phytoplasma]
MGKRIIYFIRFHLNHLFKFYLLLKLNLFYYSYYLKKYLHLFLTCLINKHIYILPFFKINWKIFCFFIAKNDKKWCFLVSFVKFDNK